MKYLPLVFLFVSTLSLSQSLDSLAGKQFLKTYSGNLFVVEKHQTEIDSLQELYFVIEGQSIRLDEIEFFQDTSGLYANILKAPKSKGNSQFMKCLERGSLNYYSYVSYLGSDDGFSTVNKEYINEGFGELELAKPALLKSKVSESPESLKQLKKYKFQKSLSTGMLASGLGLFVGGLAIWVSQNSETESTKTDLKKNSLGMMYAGLGLVALQIPLVLTLPSKQKIVALYNK